jgi:Cu(I)/Ag(I) efflux system membrane fusion protein
VELPGGEGPLFEGREVVLGPRAGEFYVVRSGLEEGELVVTEGAFKIDSELQIRAQPSMMAPQGESAPHLHQHAGTGKAPAAAIPKSSAATDRRKPENAQVAMAFNRYFEIQMALARDDLQRARAGFQNLSSILSDDDRLLRESGGAQLTNSQLNHLHQAASAGASAENIARVRALFYELSLSMIDLQGSSGNPTSSTVYLVYCPMARDDSGASWLQTSDTIANPYFGSAMLRCGEIQGTFPAEPSSGR